MGDCKGYGFSDVRQYLNEISQTFTDRGEPGKWLARVRHTSGRALIDPRAIAEGISAHLTRADQPPRRTAACSISAPSWARPIAKPPSW